MTDACAPKINLGELVEAKNEKSDSKDEKSESNEDHSGSKDDKQSLENDKDEGKENLIFLFIFASAYKNGLYLD